MIAEQDRDHMIESLVRKLYHLADEKDGLAMNLPRIDEDQKYFLQGMAQAYRDIIARIERGDWI